MPQKPLDAIKIFWSGEMYQIKNQNNRRSWGILVMGPFRIPSAITCPSQTRLKTCTTEDFVCMQIILEMLGINEEWKWEDQFFGVPVPQVGQLWSKVLLMFQRLSLGFSPGCQSVIGPLMHFMLAFSPSCLTSPLSHQYFLRSPPK